MEKRVYFHKEGTVRKALGELGSRGFDVVIGENGYVNGKAPRDLPTDSDEIHVLLPQHYKESGIYVIGADIAQRLGSTQIKGIDTGDVLAELSLRELGGEREIVARYLQGTVRRAA